MEADLGRSNNNGEYRCSLTLGDPDARLMDWIAQSEYVYKHLVLLNEFVLHLGTIKCTAEYRIGGVTIGFAVIFKDVPLHEVRSPTCTVLCQRPSVASRIRWGSCTCTFYLSTAARVYARRCFGSSTGWRRTASSAS